MNLVTVLTPTYNRVTNLEKLYESLCNQSSMNFLWLVVDDGSTDNTQEIVDRWHDDSKIQIQYIKKENGGKHTALNLAISQIETELTFIVDSDDWLDEKAIEIIECDYESYKSEEICGLAYLRQSKTGKFLTNKLVPYDGLIEDYCTCRLGRRIDGDMAEVWVTKCLKEYPFPTFKNEKFMSEDVVWVSMASKYKIVFFNKAIYYSDYLEGGLTVNRREHNKKSPKGCMHRGIVLLEAKIPIKDKFRAMLYYIVYGKFAGYSYKQLFLQSKKKILFLLLFLPSVELVLKWR